MRSHGFPARAAVLVIVAVALIAGACGGGDGGGADASREDAKTSETTTFVAQVASYELVAGAPQRFLAGISGRGTGTVVSFGAVEMEFFFLGTREAPVDPPQSKAKARGRFVPIPGRDVPGDAGNDPREVRPSEGVGVYQATGVTFDAPGMWGVILTATIGGEEVVANASFGVRAEPRVPAPGQPAPRTENPTIGSVGANSKALDSRATASAAVPDPEMHSSTVAAALAAGRPVVVVVSTPVYCVSQFCGPITDVAHGLAKTYGDRATFVHIEVWEDFEAKKVNAAAREWVQPGGTGDLNEPWVFLVGGDGVIVERFDNLVADADFEAAVKQLVGA